MRHTTLSETTLETATVMVVAREPEHGRALTRRIAASGARALGPWPDTVMALTLEQELCPDLCALVLPPLGGRRVVQLVPRLLDRREPRALVVRLAEPFGDRELTAALELALARGAELAQVEREALDPLKVMRDLDALMRAKSVLTHELPMTERHASERLRHVAADHGERLADVARRVWARRGSLAGDSDLMVVPPAALAA
ncbi:hypothetical protein Q5424_20025 [Conexibacter sp. JD483]|uniref:hypothetical protein n=1 Tax=unclassified Conexibacter TaxID=2627773 RepID=UPI0027236322|nr:MULTISPECIES: hypothetical protein [unclassified Conexibacter]MDO8187385.1 hypothetical protein [Conexibacter sp. CPCC 205706]MDO8200980.1 hypothetical protein [Conexibacter sp. CPCC 205762]MDR9371398.1 hypothetical protein [Conexibacter sp. JD483]